MSDSNDWNQPPSNQPWPGAPSQQGAPAPAPNGPQHNGPQPASSENLLTDGWGGGALEFEAVKARFALALSRASGSILKSWLILALIPLTFNLIGAVLSIMIYYLGAGILSTLFGVASVIISIVAIPLTLAAAVGQWALFKPLHHLIFEDPIEKLDAIGTLKSVKPVLIVTLTALFIAGLSTGVGMLFCVLPGLFLGFILSQTTYLTAARGVAPMDAAKQSITLNKKYWQAVLVAVGVMFVAVVGIVTAVGVVGFISAFLRPFSGLVNTLVAWVIVQAFSFGVFLLHTALFSSIESKELGRNAV